jgi:hypothetical protein
MRWKVIGVYYLGVLTKTGWYVLDTCFSEVKVTKLALSLKDSWVAFDAFEMNYTGPLQIRSYSPFHIHHLKDSIVGCVKPASNSQMTFEICATSDIRYTLTKLSTEILTMIFLNVMAGGMVVVWEQWTVQRRSTWKFQGNVVTSVSLAGRVLYRGLSWLMG